MLSLKSSFSFIISPCFSPSSPRPIPLALSSVTLSRPCSPLFPLVLPSHLSVLSPLLSVIISPWLSPSHTQSFPPARGRLLFGAVLPLCSKATLFQPLFGSPLPPFFGQRSLSSKQCMTPVAVAVFYCPQGAPAASRGRDPSPAFCFPHGSPLPVVKTTSLHFAASNLPWPEGSLAAQLMSWLICMQPATGLEGAHSSPKYPPWQPSDTDQARIQMENKGLCSHNPGAVVVHRSEGSLVVRKKCLSKQSSFSSCLQELVSSEILRNA